LARVSDDFLVQTSASPSSAVAVAALEPFNAASSVYQLLTSGVVGVTLAAELYMHVPLSGAREEGVAAAAGHPRKYVGGVYVLLHLLPRSLPDTKNRAELVFCIR